MKLASHSHINTAYLSLNSFLYESLSQPKPVQNIRYIGSQIGSMQNLDILVLRCDP